MLLLLLNIIIIIIIIMQLLLAYKNTQMVYGWNILGDKSDQNSNQVYEDTHQNKKNVSHTPLSRDKKFC